MNVWIQKHNFESEELPDSGLDAALHAYSAFNWLIEIASYQTSLQGKKDGCPPGIGFVHQNGDLLHFCPLSSEISEVHYYYSFPSRFLGLFPYVSNRDFHLEDFPLCHMRDVLHSHYRGDTALTLDKLHKFEQNS
ncbi:hypothetical protein JIN85_18640 [Luteolibacter pohnpeiensis]|uniref:Uncharacterized protein n=1 Tax=Luteolibacter pohnpeiensis TaxID=454153 RepID=A0A934S823_9BACT|nr:hypothetical protein [Luteolibacter pohnpeiensis]MBK1884441.1 hypothetical protein [Luteolibacter pohnpeiensis]